jgi:hypothetical protein
MTFNDIPTGAAVFLDADFDRVPGITRYAPV